MGFCLEKGSSLEMNFKGEQGWKHREQLINFCNNYKIIQVRKNGFLNQGSKIVVIVRNLGIL